MTPSGNAQVGTGEARRVPVAPLNATGDGPPPAINMSLGGFLLLFVASRLLSAVRADHLRLEAGPALGVHADAALLVLDHPARCRRARGRLLRPLVLFLASAVDRLLRGRTR